MKKQYSPGGTHIHTWTEPIEHKSNLRFSKCQFRQKWVAPKFRNIIFENICIKKENPTII